MDVWLDGTKVGFYSGTTVNIQVSAATGKHQLDIYAVGTNGELQETTSIFTVGSTTSGGGTTGGTTGGTCATPSSPGVNICSPLNGSTVTSPVTITAAGRNSGTTSGMDVWIDGVKFKFYSGATTVNAQATLATGAHELDIYAVGTNGELQEGISKFTVGTSTSGGGTGGTSNTAPFGNTDAATGAQSGNSTLSQSDTLNVSGWAADVQDGAPVARVAVLIDGTAVGNATLGGSRPDVSSAYSNSAYTNSGWSFSYAASTLAVGSHTVTAVAYDSQGLAQTLSSTLTISVTSGGTGGTSNTAPFGWVDKAVGTQSGTSTVSQSDTLSVAGWAADTQDGAPVARVAVLIDGTAVGNATLGGSRPDVASAYNNPAYTNSGWSFTYPATNLAAGNHKVTAVAYDSQGLATTFGSATISVTSVGGTGTGSATQINHVILMLQENRSFDNYFGMLNAYRKANGWNVGADGQEYDVDGLDGSKSRIVNTNDEGTSFVPFKLATSCIDDLSSAWLESYGDVSPWSFSTSRPIAMNGFVHIAEGFAKDRGLGDTLGKRTMGYYDQTFLNYYYFMASQFALSDRWFSPVSAKTVPNRIATMTGGTTQGLTKDPSSDDHLGQLSIPTIFQELDNAGVSWKIYYTDVESSGNPSTSFTYFTYANRYIGDTNHLAPLSQFYTDVQNGTLPAFAYIEPGFNDGTDEHPGVDIIRGQRQVANLVNAVMNSVSWKDSVFFFTYDEGGPFDHVPPVPGHTNQYTDATLGITTDISSIAVNPDSYMPCPLVSGSFHCDLKSYGSYADPGYNSGDAAAQQGFAAQLGFRVPNFVVSPFVRKHYVSHVPMDTTAVIKFVESRFISSTAHLTARDAAQPNLLDFFDFTNVPWAQPPAPPAPSSANACNPSNLTPAP